MRILILSSKFPYPLKDGGAIATYNLAKGLYNSGNQVNIISFNSAKHFVDESKIPKENFEGINYRLVSINNSPNLFGALLNLVFSSKPYILQRFNSSKFTKALSEILLNNQFDVVQIEGLYMLQYIPTIRANTKVAISYRPHNIEHQIWKLNATTTSNLAQKVYFKNLAKRILNYENLMLNDYDLLLPISEEDANFYSKSDLSKPFLLTPTGFEFSNYTPAFSAKKQHALFFIGSLEWIPNQNGICWFIDNCWEKIYKKRPGLKLYIAGRNAPKWLINKIEKPGVVWKGEIENAWEFIEDKSIMIVPLFSGSGMRIKIIEAFILGKPVVSTNLGTRGTMALNNKHILHANNKEDFVEKLIKLIENDNLYENIASKAYKLAKNEFNTTIISEKLTQFYKQNLNSQ